MEARMVRLAVIWTIFVATSCVAAGDRKIRMDEVKSITLRRGQMTRGRRASPVPQLTCIGSYCGTQYDPEVVQCVNVGTDGLDAQWKCNADLNNGLSFGLAEVSCEGYDYPDDPFILAGSCGLEYRLKGTPVEDRHGSGYHNDYHSGQNNYGHYQSRNDRRRYRSWESDASWDWGTILVLGVIGWIVYQAMNVGGNEPTYNGGPGRGGGPGGPGGPGGGGGFGGGGGGGNNWGNRPSGANNNNNNFWWGLLTGGGLANLFGGGLGGNWGGYGRNYYNRPRYGGGYYNNGYDYGYGYRNRPQGYTDFGNFGGGRGGVGSGTRTHTTRPATRQATAFAGTRRR